MFSSRHDPATRRVVALLGALLLASPPAPARADQPPPATELDAAASPGGLRLEPPSFPARAAPGPTPWRAVAEEGIILAVSLVGYAVTRPPANGAHPVPFLDKLTFAHGAWGWDADSLPTNYVGHPVAGLFFYQVARGNRLGVGASLGLTLATAWVWELAEYNELASVHDVVATTAGGVALGEAFTQLAAWLGQREGAVAQVASMVFQVPRAFHDWRDGAPPAAAARWGLADVAAWTSTGASWPRPEGEEAELRFGARARLVRAALVGEPGAGWQTLLDGNVTSLAAELALGMPGLVEVDLTGLASLAGAYGRDFDAAGDGHDLLATVSLGFDYLRRAEPVEGTWANDYLALVRVPGVELVAGLRRGAVRAELGLETAVTLGGVQPLPLLGRPSDLPGAPGVLRLSGYYHGLGAMLAPRASLTLGPVELAVSCRFDRLQAIEGYDVSPPPDGGHLALQDERRDLRGRLSWRTPWAGVRLFASAERRDRWGRAGDVTATLRDSTALLGVGVGP
jgi:hypothetical protein